MIKVVIADDEVRVCKLICNLIDWKALDMEIVGVAHNGIEALELIEKLQPDLMITDIRMPGCDGLEMIEKGKQIKEDVDFIIISGYSHFEYAQTAIKYGVSDYLLKPINKNELLNTLNKIREKYRRKTQQLSREEELQLQLKDNIGKLRSGFFVEMLLNKNANRADMKVDEINKNYLFKFQPDCFQIFIFKVDCKYKDLCENMNVVGEKIVQTLNKSLGKECFDVETYLKNSRVYGILNYDKAKQDVVRKKLKSSFDDILMQQRLYHEIEFTVGLGRAVEDIKQLEDSLLEAQWAIRQRLVEGTGNLLEYAELKNHHESCDSIIAELTENIESPLEVLDSEGVICEINLLKEKMLNKPNISGQEIFDLVTAIYSNCLMLLRKYKFNISDSELLYETFLLHADLCSSAEELFELLVENICKSLGIIVKDKMQTDIKPIYMAKQYIQQNYMKPITLKDVSDFVGFNDSYFSFLFKKESGKNFTEYLSEVRLNKAKELLKETNMNIANICEVVGYADLKHFRKSFTKYTGLRPNEYRKLYA
ncbi:response regulator [Tepidanaerobacter sp. EBM-38]|uniref:response regulator transcription factor n=1 Tax=Tepidanaerobacter sp. EBM-38 TaxID=1918496 RepID=UPI000AA56647|nr:response regulator [Tepidanaerobacter sp. EBM-38]